MATSVCHDLPESAYICQSQEVLQWRSVVPFWLGEWGAEVFILFSSRALHFPERNSPPLAERSCLTFPYGAESARNLFVSLILLRKLKKTLESVKTIV